MRSRVFSAKFACPDCGYSLTELSPRLFSFNSPVGACAECDGLGVKEFFDPELVVNTKIKSWRMVRFVVGIDVIFIIFKLFKSLAKHYKFDLEIPFTRLPKKIQNIIVWQ